MRVRIPSPLRSYTDQRAWVEGEGATVDELLATSTGVTPACGSASSTNKGGCAGT